MKDILSELKPDKFEGQALDIDTGQEKWQGQEVGVNSNIPLVDAGIGQPYILRQFEFQFDPEKLRLMNDKKIAVPTKQELFNSVWNGIRATLWGDGLVAIEDPMSPPRVLTYKRHFKVILLCEARAGNVLIERPNTLQQVLKPKKAKSA